MKKRSPGGCSSFLFLLFVAFLALRVAGVVDWSWWWVTSPLWLPAAVLFAGLGLAAVLGVSVYKIAAAALRKQGLGRSGGRVPSVLSRTRPPATSWRLRVLR